MLPKSYNTEKFIDKKKCQKVWEIKKKAKDVGKTMIELDLLGLRVICSSENEF